jgi:hypothetical protein
VQISVLVEGKQTCFSNSHNEVVEPKTKHLMTGVLIELESSLIDNEQVFLQKQQDMSKEPALQKNGWWCYGPKDYQTKL